MISRSEPSKRRGAIGVDRYGEPDRAASLLLKDLAAMTPCSENIGQVMGQYLNFASLENNLFSLLLPQSFVQLNGSTDADAEAIVEQIVTGLLPRRRGATAGCAKTCSTCG